MIRGPAVTLLALATTAWHSAPPPVAQAVALGDRTSEPLARPDWNVSADGAYVVFASQEPLLPADRNRLRDIYVLDRRSGQLTLETDGHAGARSDGESTMPDIDGSGRLVVFISVASNLTSAPVSADLPGLYLRDRQSGTTALLSGRAANPAISDDGSSVVFESTVPCGARSASLTTGAPQVCLVRLGAGGPLFVAPPDPSRFRGRQAVSPALDATGARVVFVATANRRPTQDGPDTHRAADIYLWTVAQGTTVRISQAADGAPGNRRSFHPAISADGRHVAFASEATNLARDVRSPHSQVFVYDTAMRTMSLVSRTADGRPGNGASIRPAVSGDGRRIAFQSLASDLPGCDGCSRQPPDVNLLWDVFLRDVDASSTQPIAADLDPVSGTHGVAIDGTGTVLAYGSRQPRNPADVREDVDLFVVAWPRSDIAHRRAPPGHP